MMQVIINKNLDTDEIVNKLREKAEREDKFTDIKVEKQLLSDAVYIIESLVTASDMPHEFGKVKSVNTNFSKEHQPEIDNLKNVNETLKREVQKYRAEIARLHKMLHDSGVENADIKAKGLCESCKRFPCEKKIRDSTGAAFVNNEWVVDECHYYQENKKNCTSYMLESCPDSLIDMMKDAVLAHAIFFDIFGGRP